MSLLGPASLVVVLAFSSIGRVDPTVPRPVFTVQDPRIDEASGLVDLGPGDGQGLMVVTNDSGDAGIVYVLDGSGRTVGTTRFGESRDAESLAPATDGEVWVGDTGDNSLTREDIVVRKVPVGRGDRTVTVPAYRLSYPDGPHDAETLLVDPRTGRLYVVTKSLFASGVYAAPRTLDPDRVNRLTKVAAVSLTATDGAVFPDGGHVILRGYGSANVYTFPAFHLVGGFRLPGQPQGESISIGPRDRIRIGSEGKRQPVLRIRLPAPLAAKLAPARSATPSPSGADDTKQRSGETGSVSKGTEEWVFWSMFGALAVAMAGMVTAARALRRRQGPDA